MRIQKPERTPSLTLAKGNLEDESGEKDENQRKFQPYFRDAPSEGEQQIPALRGLLYPICLILDSTEIKDQS